MSYQTKINGFTIWANYRLQLVGHDPMESILTDFLKGYNLKLLLESLTGRPLHKMKTFDGLTDGQKEMRIQWLADECKTCGILKDRVKVECRLMTRGSFQHIADFLWNLVCFDIEFVWVRSEYMRQRNIEKLIAIPFTCVPPPWSTSTTGSQLTHVINSKTAAKERDGGMISKTKLGKGDKVHENCILEMINKHLKMTRDGKKQSVSTFSDVLNVSVLCALLNSVLADTFISDVLLNDRWTLTLILETTSDVLRFSSRFSLDDLMEADKTSLCSYFTAFFMAGYSLRQSKAVIERLDFLSFSCLKFTEELSKLKAGAIRTGKEATRLEELEELLKNYNKEIGLINANYDILSCREWLSAASAAQHKAWVTISNAMKRKYEIIPMPMNLSVKDLSDELFVNLEISASGYYQLTCKESVTNERKIVVQHKESGKFYDFHKVRDGKNQRTARGVLGISSASTQDLAPKDFPDFHIFLETLSSNKALRAGWLFLYQIFPDDTSQALNLLFKSIKNGEMDTVKNLIAFFQSDPVFVNGAQGHGKTTALHLACRLGKFDMVLYLLEENADIDVQNSFGNTPLHVAIENGKQTSRDICKLLIEWGANINIANKNKMKPLEDPKNTELCNFLLQLHDYWVNTTPKLTSGDRDLLRSVAQMSDDCQERLSTLRSRCVQGSTLLHIASYYGYTDIITQLLVLGLDINIRDHEFATPLHKAKSVDTIRLLIKHGGDISLTDEDENTSLHCILGAHKENKNIDCDAIRFLVSKGIRLLQRNCRCYTAIHCASARGSTEALRTLLELDSKGIVKQTLNNDTIASLPSVVYLAIENDHLACARWLLENGFRFKVNEDGEILQQILTGKIKCTDSTSTFQLLFENSTSLISAVFPGGNTCLHMASTSIDMLPNLQQFIDFKCDVNQKNDNNWTPLHYASNSNNYQAAAILLKHGADVAAINSSGLKPFDYIDEYDHWITSGLFDDVLVETLHAFSLKKTRELVRSITEKLKKADLADARNRNKR